MTDPDQKERLAQLEDRIDVVKKAADIDQPPVEEHYSQANLGWQMVIEMVAGLGIGFGIGYGLDSLFGTIPIFLVLFTLLGFVAGVKTMLRTAEEFQKKKLAEEADEKTNAGADRPATGETD